MKQCPPHRMTWIRHVDRFHDEYKCEDCGRCEVNDVMELHVPQKLIDEEMEGEDWKRRK